MMTSLINQQESLALNEAIRKICDDKQFSVAGLEMTGKKIPYQGWYWRAVDFTRSFSLGHNGEWAGFMENNKWDYTGKRLTPEQCRLVIDALRLAVDTPANVTLQNVFDVIQQKWDDVL